MNEPQTKPAPVAGMNAEQMRIALAKEAGFIEQPNQYYIDRREWMRDGERYATPDLPNYPKDANAALEIISMMDQRGFDVIICRHNAGCYHVQFCEPSREHEDADASFPMAVCKAALKALKPND